MYSSGNKTMRQESVQMFQIPKRHTVTEGSLNPSKSNVALDHPTAIRMIFRWNKAHRYEVCYNIFISIEPFVIIMRGQDIQVWRKYVDKNCTSVKYNNNSLKGFSDILWYCTRHSLSPEPYTLNPATRAKPFIFRYYRELEQACSIEECKAVPFHPTYIAFKDSLGNNCSLMQWKSFNTKYMAFSNLLILATFRLGPSETLVQFNLN